MAKYTKYSTQNVLDYLLTYLGNTNSLIGFMKDNGMTNLAEFKYKGRIDIVNPKPNAVLNYYQKNNVIVATGDDAALIGDFNIDYNIDFLI